MPALFGYLIAVALLLGGGYGALTWLAAPQPAEVAVKARSKTPSPLHYTENYTADPEPDSTTSLPPEASPSQPNSSATNGGDWVKTATNDESASREPPQPETAAMGATKSTGATGPAQQDQRAPPVDAKASPADVEHQTKRTEAVPPVLQGKTQSTETRLAATKIGPRSPPRQTGHHSAKKPALEVMTLRTIEYPDGRRVSQLIPYSRDGRSLAFDPDE